MIQPINWFILLKQKEKNMEGKIVYQDDKNLCENEFEVISIDEFYSGNMRDIKEWDTVIKWPHSWDKITVDDEEFWIIRPENILAIKK